MPADIVTTLRTWGRLSAADLRQRLDVSPATLMRAARDAGDQVLMRGRARRSAYAARRELRGNMAPIPVYRIDENGAAHEQGLLNLTYPDGSVLDRLEALEWPLHGAEMEDGWYDGIPYPMLDMRPQGFLGRGFARRHARLLQVDEDPNRWSDDDALHALTLLGDDTPGNFILGEPAYRLWLATMRNPREPIGDTAVAGRYPMLANQAMQHGDGGSSAAGEFPKFTTTRRIGVGAEVTQVIVKFSGNDDSEGTQRWSDLLVCEHLAATLAPGLLPSIRASTSTIHQMAGRTFLEVERFDRHRRHGRSGLLSLHALNAALVGSNQAPWPATVQRLDDLGLLQPAVVEQSAALWHFGKLIANDDMHEGNLSFQPALPGQAGLRLAPVYDMLPMLYAPARGVELAPRQFEPALPLPRETRTWLRAARVALEFWRLASGDERISAGFRAICAENALRIEEAILSPVLAGAAE